MNKLIDINNHFMLLCHIIVYKFYKGISAKIFYDAPLRYDIFVKIKFFIWIFRKNLIFRANHNYPECPFADIYSDRIAGYLERWY